MFTKEEQTEERVASYVDALKSERNGYVARQDRAKIVGDNAEADLMQTRIQAVDDEISRFKGYHSPASSSSSSAKADREATVERATELGISSRFKSTETLLEQIAEAEKSS